MFSSSVKCNENKIKIVTKRLSKAEKEGFKLDGFLREVLIGKILGGFI
jgi:hypothetical protein